MNTTNKDHLIQQLDHKFEAIHQKTETHLEGLLWSKPITYWDYLQTDVLLNLQTQRTTLPDEMVFIMYHQINELIFKMVIWEIDQVAHNTNLDASFFLERLTRISRYFDMLTTSFSIMEEGMDIDQYMKFRTTLTPASGFQSSQYRMIEFAMTDLINLTDRRYRPQFSENESLITIFENLYWQAAGKDHETGKKSFLLQEFERKYKASFLQQMLDFRNCNLWQKFKQLPEADQKNPEIINAMRHLDFTVNITWVLQHYNTAIKYIDGSGKGDGEATGGSDWKKYLHPKFQKRIFFPALWSQEELSNWGEVEIDPK